MILDLQSLKRKFEKFISQYSKFKNIRVKKIKKEKEKISWGITWMTVRGNTIQGIRLNILC